MAIFLGALFIVTCILLIVVVLLQKGRGGGLGAVFGGAASSAFGARTGDVFTWVTIVLTALFLVLAVGAIFAFRPEMLKVAAPQFAPPGGAIDGPTKVRLACETEGARIYWTADGTEPSKTKSEKYIVPIEVKPPMTIKARAFRKGMLDSDVATATYTLAAEQPEGEEQPESRPASQPAGQPAMSTGG